MKSIKIYVLALGMAVCLPLVACGGNKSVNEVTQNDNTVTAEGIDHVAQSTVNESDSIKKLIYNLYFIPSWMDEEYDFGPIYPASMKERFAKYGITKELPGLEGDKTYDFKNYKPYFTSDFKKRYGNGGGKLWRGSIPDIGIYDYEVSEVIPGEGGNMFAILKNSGKDYAVFTLRKENGQWKISDISYYDE